MVRRPGSPSSTTCRFASSTATTIFLRDVAYAHAGAPPQINMVRVDGSNAVLMTILKTGSGVDA